MPPRQLEVSKGMPDENPPYEQLQLEEGALEGGRPSLKRSNAGLAHYWIVDPQVWWRHPAARIFVPHFIMALDFFVYGEDPVNDSRVEYNFPILGHWYGLLCLWPTEVPLIIYRVIIIAISTAIGIYVGRQWIHHRWLRDRLKMTMFEGNNGTLLVMVFTIFIFLFFGALVYNYSLGGSFSSPISANTYMEFYKWGKVFQIFSVFLDIVSIIMITDAVLQDRTYYPEWASRFKDIWIDGCGGWLRVLAAQFTFVAMMFLVVVAVLSTGHGDGKITWKDTFFIGGLSEVWRTNMLSLCVFCDLFAVAQDWEFPSFKTPVDVKIAGSFADELSFTWLKNIVGFVLGCIPSSLTSRLSCSWCYPKEDIISFFHFKMTGPWLAYMPLVLAVIFGDLVCGKNQFTYNPVNYGQYVDPNTQRIWTIMDKEYLAKAYEDGYVVRKELVTYEARRSADGKPLDASAAQDVLLNARYVHKEIFTNFGSITDSELLAFMVGFLLAIGFVILVRGGEKVWKSKPVSLLGRIAS